MENVRIIEIRSEIGAGTRGASLGVDAIRIAALDYSSHYFDKHQVTAINDENRLLYSPEESPYAKRINGVLSMYERISEVVKESMVNGEFPIILTGDHSSAGGIISGIKMAYPKDRIGVIWLDAHADMHTPFTTPSGNMHGMPLAVALGEDNQTQKVNSPDKNVTAAWDKLKKIGGISPKLQYRDLVFVGLRDKELQEDFLIKKNEVKVVGIPEIRRKGSEMVAKEVFMYLKHCKYIFLSFDVDVIDSKVSKGTGTPVPGGLSEKEVKNLVQDLVQNERICAFEITEVNPTLDNENVMAEIAFETLQRVTNYLRNK